MAKSFIVHILPKMLDASKKKELIEANTDRGESMDNIYIAKHAQHRIRISFIKFRSAIIMTDFKLSLFPIVTLTVFLFYLCYFDVLDLAVIDFSFSEN
jgi:hypothetical protein